MGSNAMQESMDLLKEHGATFVRKTSRGGELWRMPGGRQITIPSQHEHGRGPANVLAQVRRALGLAKHKKATTTKKETTMANGNSAEALRELRASTLESLGVKPKATKRKLVIEETEHTIKLDEFKLRKVLDMAGLEFPDKAIVTFSDTGVTINWTETKETVQ